MALEFKDLVLSKEEMEKKDTDVDEGAGKAAKQPDAVFEAVLQSGPDFVIRRTKGKKEKLLVILVSKGQYYIKDGEKIEIIPLDYEGRKMMTTFQTGMPDFIPLPDVTWLDGMYHGEGWRNHFIEALDSYSTMMKEGLFMFKGDFSWVCSRVQERLGDLKGMMKKALDAMSVRFKSRKDALWEWERTDFSGAEGLAEFGRAYGAEWAAKLVERLYSEDVLQDCCIPDFGPLTRSLCGKDAGTAAHRFCGSKEYEADYRSMGNELPVRKADPAKLVDYICRGSRRQGFGGPYGSRLSLFVDTYSDYLGLTELATGHAVEDKYPDSVDTADRLASIKAALTIAEGDAKGWTESAAVMKKRFSWKPAGGKWQIKTPENASDLADEAKQQSNCVLGYAERVSKQQDYIVFLRSSAKEDEGKSVGTIEVRPDGRIGQFYLEGNGAPLPEHIEFIRRWAKEKGLVYSGAVPMHC